MHDFILTQPQGYDTWVGEGGVKLSGGQARRLVIARALLKDAPLLILDEPGEGLDPETENAVLRNVLQHYRERSVLLITHRRAGLKAMDQLWLMEEGRLEALPPQPASV